jgi:glycosyltransferase involved in cell wall biosynthesis
VPQGELPKYYALADVLVLPASDEPWGLVINEAMAGGLAVIAHRECGAAVDLVGPENGVALEKLEVDELASAMDRILRGDQASERDAAELAAKDQRVVDRKCGTRYHCSCVANGRRQGRRFAFGRRS